MKFKKKIIEDMCAVGTGAIAGSGGAGGEPGVLPKDMPPSRKKKSPVMSGMFKRKTPNN